MTLEYGGFGIENPALLALVIPAALALYLYIRKPKMSRRKWIFLGTRSVYVFLLFAALAGPYQIDTVERFHDVSSITILADKSESASLYRSDTESVAGDIYVKLKGSLLNSTGFGNVVLKEFSSGNKTAIGDAIYQNSIDSQKDNNLIILVSDGNNNFGRDPLDVARSVVNTNTVVFALPPEDPEDEVYIVGISGDKKTPLNSKYMFSVDVGKLGKQARYNIKVSVDGRVIHTGTVTQNNELETVDLNYTFKENGVHTILVNLVPLTPDYYEANNRLIKTIDVVEKPSVLVLTSQGSSPLMDIMKGNYDVSLGNAVRGDVNTYSAVILDNVNASQLSESSIKALNQYVIDGGGLVVVGGDKSYERGGYTNSPQLEAMLPVLSVKEPEKKRKEMAVVILIDISQSTAYGLQSDSKIEIEKALALNILKQLDPKDYVGVVAFNVEAFTISDMKRLSQNKDELESNVPRLLFGGGTDMLPALDRAEKMLENLPYDKYVILISDGVLGAHLGTRSIITKEKVAAMKSKGITTYTVGVGFDTDEMFMRELASEGKGLYFKPEEYQRLTFEFEEKDAEKNKDRYKLDVYNKYHFITRNVELSDKNLVNYNEVTAKSIAQVLITTEGNKPIVTVWRYGLGRVVSLTTDNGITWSQSIYNTQGGRIVSSLTNWAIGDLEKKKSTRIEVSDGGIGWTSDVLVLSEEKPALYLRDDSGKFSEVELRQTDLSMYSAKLELPSMGFYPLKASSSSGEDIDGIAINYPVEYSRLGVNEKALRDIAGLSGGKVYGMKTMTELIEDVTAYIRQGSFKETLTRVQLGIYLLGAALGLFFLDAVIRRVNEIRRLMGK